MTKSEIAIFQLDNGQTEIQVKLDNDTVWLSQKQMSDIFEKDSDTIGLHLKNIYQTGELDEASTTEYSSVVRMEGKRKVTRKIKFYNLDENIPFHEFLLIMRIILCSPLCLSFVSLMVGRKMKDENMKNFGSRFTVHASSLTTND